MIGLYTECLLKLLTTPNMGVLEMLNRVGNNVSELAKRQGKTQQPVCVSLCSNHPRSITVCDSDECVISLFLKPL